MDKKGIQLTIGMVVIIIIALVTLVIVISMVYELLQAPRIIYPDLKTPPTADDPIVIAPVEVPAGIATGMTIGFYNGEESAVSEEVTPKITCAGIEIEFEAVGMPVDIGEDTEYNVIIKVPSDAEKRVYSCSATISNTHKSFMLTVN